MTEPSPAPPGSFHPRNGAILTSGILLALSGLGSLGSGAMAILQVFLMKRLGSLDPKAAKELAGFGESMWSISLANLVIYGGIGIVFVYAAIGCFRYRRWARAMNLTLGWGWLYMGVVTMMSLVVMMGPMREAMNGAMTKAVASTPGATAPPPLPMGGIFTFVMIFYLLLVVLFVIVPPAIILWLNWSRDVRHTLEWRDPVARWTDRLPVGLSGLVIASVCFALVSLPGVFLMNEPWMTPVLGDGPGKHAWWLMPVAWAYVAWGTLRRQLAAWFAAMVSLLAGAVTGFLSFRGTNWAELYKGMGMPEDDLGEMAAMMESMFDPQKMMILMIVGFVPLFGYLFWIFKDFRKPAAA
jgi:hypothetical protein